MFDKRLWLAERKSWVWMGVCVLAGGVGGVLVVGQAWFLSLIIDQVFLGGAGIAGVLGYLKILLFPIIGRAVLVWAREMAGGVGAIEVKATLRKDMFSHLLQVGPIAEKKGDTGGVVAALLEGVDALDAYFRKYLPQIALSALIPLTILVFVFPTDILSGVVLLVTAPLIPLFMVLIGKMADEKTQKQYKLLGRLSSHFLDVMQGLKTLKLLGRSKDQIEEIRNVSTAYADATMTVLRTAFLSALALELLSTLSTAIVAVEIGLRLLGGNIDFQSALFILILAPEFYLPLRRLGLYFHDGMEGLAAAEKIFSILSLKKIEGASPVMDYRFHDSIEFGDVSYSYAGGKRQSLRGVSFRVEHGEKVALVGASGAGKSTIVNLLMRFITPREGGILVDGVPLENISLGAWRENVSLVSQSPALFYGTLLENLQFAKPDACDEEIKRAVRLAQLDELVVSLPEGLETWIGERGYRLSGGEAQRLAVARAFLKDAPIMILDEPTAHLDPKYEAGLNEAISELMKGRTVLVVAHRISSVLDADKIVVIEEGKVVERGKHDSLLNAEGVYWNLVKAYVGGGG